LTFAGACVIMGGPRMLLARAKFYYTTALPLLSIGNLHKKIIVTLPKFVLDRPPSACYTCIIKEREVQTMNEFTFYLFLLSPMWVPGLMIIGFAIKQLIDSFKK